MSAQLYDLIVIGAGTAGLTAVQEALDFFNPERVALVEPGRLGGECAHYACVPTKVMLTAAKHLRHLIELMPEYGICTKEVMFEFRALMEKKSFVIEEGSYPFLQDKRLTLLQGEASFTSPDSLMVNGGVIRGDRIIIATGSLPDIPPLEGLETVPYWTYRDVTTMNVLPQSIAMIGAGPVGVEMSYMLQILGCKVTLLESFPRILKREEPEISDCVKKQLESLGIKVVLNCKINHVNCLDDDHTLVEVQSEDGHCSDLRVEKVVFATGMKPTIQPLNLDAAGIAYDDKAIFVDDAMQTTNPKVWAVGDVVGPYRFTHVADKQAEIAVRNALGGEEGRPVEMVDYTALNWAIFTEPAVAHVGATEEEALQAGQSVVAVTAVTEQVSRYRIESQPEGFVKFVIDGDTSQILGAHFYAYQAEELAQIVTLAVHHHMTVEQMLSMFYIYPARSQLLQKALEKYRYQKHVGLITPRKRVKEESVS